MILSNSNLSGQSGRRPALIGTDRLRATMPKPQMPLQGREGELNPTRSKQRRGAVGYARVVRPLHLVERTNVPPAASEPSDRSTGGSVDWARAGDGLQPLRSGRPAR